MAEKTAVLKKVLGNQKNMGKDKLALAIIFCIATIFFCGCIANGGENSGETIECTKFAAEACPEKCVVCPPCSVCSSISCQTEEFCKSMGIDKNWYAQIKQEINRQSEK